jgi:putative RecB family exonuclease
MAMHQVQHNSGHLDIEVTPTERAAGTLQTPVRWHSVSSTREYERCPRRYRYAYIERLPQDRHVPIPWRVGSAVHVALEAAYGVKQRDLTAPLEAGIPQALAALRRSWDALDLPYEQRYGRAARQVVRSLHDDVLQVDEVVGVELALRDELTPGDRIAGLLDLLLRRDGSTMEIVDHKVTARRATVVDVATDFQLNLYGALVRMHWPEVDTIRATLHYPTGPDRVTSTLYDEGMDSARAQVERIADRAAADTTFTPTPGDHCGHCPWRPRCPAG